MPARDKEREERLAAALRDNLRRRKAQERSKSAAREEPTPDTARSFRLGMDMLANPAAAGEWLRAIELIESAALKHHPDAAERMALFECMGAGRPPDWPKGLDWLARAAELGSPSAARQLSLLAGAEGEPHELRARIDMDRCLRPPPPRELTRRPLIRAFAGFATFEECQWLIDRVAERLGPAIVADPVSGKAVADPVRNNRSAVFQFTDLDIIVEMIRMRLSIAIGATPAFLEASQVLHYRAGEEFKPHHDYLDPSSALAGEIARNGQRAATVLIFLNDDFEGGETRFPAIGLDYRGRTGDALMWSNVDPSGRPEPASLHAGLPPTRGEKWVFSQWVRDQYPA